MSSNGEVQLSTDLDGFSGFILAVFIVVSVFVIWPVHVPLPTWFQRLLLKTLLALRIIGNGDHQKLVKRQLHFPLSLETAPLIGVILLLITTTINGSTIVLGIKGDENIKPFDVLVLFISLAYISIALDGTGALEAIAFWVSKNAGTSGLGLFASLYVFFLGVGCIVGNDPLILSGTPFLAYLCHHTGIEPTAWIFSEFMAANTASAVLVSSNPTNILITGSFGLNYLTGFTKYTVLPSIIPAILNFPLLLTMFWNKIPKKLVPLKDNPWSKLRDPVGAVFFATLLVVTVVILVGTTFVPGGAVQVWMVTAPAGILAFCFDLGSDWWAAKQHRRAIAKGNQDEAAEMHSVDHTTSHARKGSRQSHPPLRRARSGGDAPRSDPKSTETNTTLANTSISPSGSDTPDPIELPDTAAPSSLTHKSRKLTLISLLGSFSTRFPGTSHTISRLPLPLLPFAASEFILIRGLSQRHWITVFATGFSHACTSLPATIFFFGFISAAFLCPLAGTNIGATILLVEILRDSAFAQSRNILEHPDRMQGAIYSVAMGSNIGAFSYTFAGSLAGLLWRGLLKDKGVTVGQGKFAGINALPLLMQIVVSSLVVWGEIGWFGGTSI